MVTSSFLGPDGDLGTGRLAPFRYLRTGRVTPFRDDVTAIDGQIPFRMGIQLTGWGNRCWKRSKR